jgi:phenylalanyl-tRNA synthetase beta chain
MATVYLPREEENSLPEEKKTLVFGFYGEGDFYYLKSSITALLGALRVKGESYRACTDNPSYHPGRCAYVSIDGTCVGVLGQVHPAVAEKYGFGKKTPVYAAELDFDAIFSFVGGDPAYKPLPKFPASTRDFSFVCDDSLEVGTIEDVLKNAKVKILEEVRLFDIYRGEQIGNGKKSVSFRVSLRQPDRTITDEEADKAVAKLLRAIEEKLGIKIRD